MIIDGHSPEHIPSVRELFIEYARALDFDLCFQNFERELAELPGSYAPPDGRLLLAREGTGFCGCVAVRPLDEETCEMKRLYVRPSFRGNGVGRCLAEASLRAARQRGYRRMRLDTLDSMTHAITLYHSLGFQFIKPYYNNTSSRALFMEVELRGERERPG